MEFLLIGGLAYLGWVVSSKGKQQRYAHEHIAKPVLRQYPFESQHAYERLKGADQTLHDKRWQESLDPRTSGIVAPALSNRQLFNPGMLPFFSSESKQNTNDGVKQTRMELFTGAIDQCLSETGTYLPKREQAPLFQPEETRQHVTSSGTAGNPSLDLKGERYAVSGRQHGVAPVEAIRVGPGLNTDVGTVARGGFHQFFRILPSNVNAYRKTNLAGRTVPGKAAVDAPTTQALVSKNGVDKVHPERGILPTRAAYTAPASRATATASVDDNGPVYAEGYAGAAYGGGAQGVAALYGHGLPTRDRPDDAPATDRLNLSATGAGVGSYATTTYDTHTFEANNRETLAAPAAGPRGPSGPTSSRGYVVGRTLRDTLPQVGTYDNMTSLTAAPTVRNDHARATGRQQLLAAYSGNPMGAAAAPAAPANQYFVKTNHDDDRTKRDKVLYSHTPGPQSGLNAFNNDMGSYTTRNDDHRSRVPGAGLLHTLDYAKPLAVTKDPKLGPVATPVDHDLAASVLRGNPLHVAIS